MGNLLNLDIIDKEEEIKQQDEKSEPRIFIEGKAYLFYWINAQNNKIALDVPLKKDNGIKVTPYPLHGGTHQKYKLYRCNDNYYNIQNLFSLKYLELNTSLIQNELNPNNVFQQFKFINIHNTDLYIITTKGHGDNMCLDGSNNSLNIYKRIQHKKQQRFTIELFNDNKPEYQVAPSTYIVWHSNLQNKTENNNKISVMYSIQPLKTHSSTYWSCVFPKGYMGIQDKNKDLKWIIFSIWDVTLNDVINIGQYTKCDLFGGEGVGVRTHIVYNWKIGMIYTFKVVYQTMENDNKYAIVSAYFLEGNVLDNNQFDDNKFQLIASIKVPNNNEYLFHGNHRFTNFTEDWDSGGGNGHIERKALFGNIKILNNDKIVCCDSYHEWCPETRPFKEKNFCVKLVDEKQVCMTIGGC